MNKYILSLLLLCGLQMISSAQNINDQNALIAKRVVTNHFVGKGENPLDFGNYRGGFELVYGRNFNKVLNFTVPFRASVIRLPEETFNRNTFSLDGVFQFQYYKNSFFTPYLLAGAGAVLEMDNTIDIQMPLGLGVNMNLNKFLFLNLQSEYRISLDGLRSNYVHGLGLGLNLGALSSAGKSEVIEKPEVVAEVAVSDRDQDSIPDEEDECPDMPGLAKFSGCPDSDNDGVGDQSDSCPDLAGPIQYKGCPDTDGDGLFDLIDNCPDQKGPRSNEGCPITDADGDGVLDTEDKCPNKKGTLRGCPDQDGDGVADHEDLCPQLKGAINSQGCPDSDGDGLHDGKDQCPNKVGPLKNSGCPDAAPAISFEDMQTLAFAVRQVNFATGSSDLLATSHPILNKLADIIERYPSYQLFINGYTDSVGNADKNRALSQARANACRQFLIDKGADGKRLIAIGFGEDNPVASNETPETRFLNRRVEFKIQEIK